MVSSALMPAARKIDYERIEPGAPAPSVLVNSRPSTQARPGSVTPQAIRKHFVKTDAPRDLAERVHATANVKVLAAMVPAKVLPASVEREVVEVESSLEATVHIVHKAAIVLTDVERAARILSTLDRARRARDAAHRANHGSAASPSEGS
jgi:hypothetical protein